MPVQLLARVVLPVPLKLVRRVLDAEDTTRAWVLGDPDAVAQAPAQQSALRRVVMGASGRKAADVKGAYLGAARVKLLCDQIKVLGAATRNDESVWCFTGEQKGPRYVLRCGRVSKTSRYRARKP